MPGIRRRASKNRREPRSVTGTFGIISCRPNQLDLGKLQTEIRIKLAVKTVA